MIDRDSKAVSSRSLLTTTENRKLWRSMISHALKRHATLYEKAYLLNTIGAGGFFSRQYSKRGVENTLNFIRFAGRHATISNSKQEKLEVIYI